MVSRLLRWNEEAVARLSVKLPLGMLSGFSRMLLTADVRAQA